MAMQLLAGKDGMIGIAVEGMEPGDEASAAQEAVDVADLTLYYGKSASFDAADAVSIVQFKYSPIRQDVEFRASDAKKTVTKFAIAYSKSIEKYGASEVESKLRFELVTNRPIFKALVEAIEGLANGVRLSEEVEEQARQLKVATGLGGQVLASFMRKLVIVGSSDSLTTTKSDLAMRLVDWTAGSDLRAKALLGSMRQMVRDKAGGKGAGQNVIRLTDVLATLEIAQPEDLLPCLSAQGRFPDNGGNPQISESAQSGAPCRRKDRSRLARRAPQYRVPASDHVMGNTGLSLSTVGRTAYASYVSDDAAV